MPYTHGDYGRDYRNVGFHEERLEEKARRKRAR